MSIIKKENVSLLNVAYDMDRVVVVLGENKVKEAIEVAKHLEQTNARQNTACLLLCLQVPFLKGCSNEPPFEHPKDNYS